MKGRTVRKLSVFLTGLLLTIPAGGAWAQDKPTPPDQGTSAATEPGVEPTSTIEVEEVSIYVDGQLVKEAPPGVEVVVRVRLHNFSDQTLRDVRAHIDPSTDARIVDADATYGTIAAGASDNGEFRVVINREGCPDFLGLGGEITYEGGKSFLKFPVPTACPGPRLNLSEVHFDDGDGDGVPEPGETVRVSVSLQNIGHDPATGVRARIRVSGKGVTTEAENLAWPDIAPEANERSITPFTLTISKEAPRQEGCQPLPGEGGGIQIPPEEGGTAAKDTPVSSDGSTPADGNVSSEPGSAGGGAPSSTGTDEPTTVEPDPGTGTAEPGTASPEPPPDRVEPGPAPERDPAALIEIHLDVAASAYTASLDYSNQVACAVAEGRGVPATDVLAKQRLAADEAAGGAGPAAAAVALATLASAAAIGVRSLLVR